MSDQQPLNNSEDDSVNASWTIEEKPDGNTASVGRDLKQPFAGETFDLDKKKKSFQITSIEKDHDVEVPGKGYTDDLEDSAESVAVLEQNNLSKSDGYSTGVPAKKKISFQVTSIESKEGRRRGDSNGYDDVDELNESEFLEDEGESPDSDLRHASGNGNGSSRFTVVKIPRYDSKMYTRGRWGCWDFVKFAPPSAVPYLNDIPGFNLDLSEKNEPDSTSKNSLVSNVSSGTVSKVSNCSPELLEHEGSVQQGNVLGETHIHDEKNPIMRGDCVGNPGPPRIDERTDMFINNSSGLGKSPESQITQAALDETTLRLDIPEDELVAEKIEKAMNQVVQIKTDLLQNVNADVKKLKQTIQQLSQENQRLKEENELLKQKLNQTKTESI